MPRRREFSKKVRREAWKRADSRCEECRCALQPGRFAYDHALADADGGEPTLENCRVRCDPCHLKKTIGENKGRAKAKRLADTAAGIKSRGFTPRPKQRRATARVAKVVPRQPIYVKG